MAEVKGIKYIRVEMRDTTIWDVPAERIADHFANVKADQECKGIKESYERLYSLHFSEILESDAALVDWASNRVEWASLLQFARLVRPASVSVYDREWPVSHKRVVVY